MTRWLLIIVALIAGCSAACCCGATGTATRTLETRESIARIVFEVVKGGVEDVGLRERIHKAKMDNPFDAILRIGRRLSSGDVVAPELRIDDRPRSGVIAWLAAVNRIAGFVCSKDRNGSHGRLCGDAARGWVEYSYRLRIRGLDIRRTTRIADGHVLLTTDISGPMAGGRLRHVRLVIRATENLRGMGGAKAPATRISGTATGFSPIGERCRIVRRIAERQIAAGLDRQLLGAIESGGRRWHEVGHVDIEGVARDFIRRLTR